mgnify:CR=1 FL=1
MLLIAIVLTLVKLSLFYFLSRQNPDSEKLSAYECGFEPYENSRYIFDVRFCLVVILFVIFSTMAISISKLSLLGFWSMIDFLF